MEAVGSRLLWRTARRTTGSSKRVADHDFNGGIAFDKVHKLQSSLRIGESLLFRVVLGDPDSSKLGQLLVELAYQQGVCANAERKLTF